MKTPSACPPPELLEQLARLELTVDQAEPIYDHLESCGRCQAVFCELPEPATGADINRKKLTLADLEAARSALRDEHLSEKAATVWRQCSGKNQRQDREPVLSVPCTIRGYEIKRLIDLGGMGEVYEGRHIHLKRPVAVKVIRGFRQDDPAAHESFLAEMETTGQLEHPNLVRAYDAWEQGGCLFLAQELLKGDSLHSLVQQGRIKSSDEVIEVMLGIFRALEQLHSHQMLHRDVTPSNVMRLEDGTIKLIDYGLAVALDAGLDAKTQRAGTEGFMAPEQEHGKASDQRSDIYAAGRVLEFLLKCLPESTWHGDPYDGLKALASNCTQAEPDHRPQSVSSIIVRLEGLQKQTAHATRSGFLGTTLNHERRGKAKHAMMFLGLGLLLAGGIFAPSLFRVPGLINKTTNNFSTVTVRGLEVGDILSVRGPDGTTRAIAFNGSSMLPLRAGAYVFSLAGAGFDRRHVSPSRLTIDGRVPETLSVLEGAGNPSAGEDAGEPQAIGPQIEMAMTEIPAGRFRMGASDGDELAGPDELPQREVVFERPFRISTYEITVGQFREFVRGTGYVTTAEATGGGWIANRSSSWGTHDPSLSWENPGYPLADTLPVTVVTYEDAKQFCEWLSQRNGSRYRLPTEAEWEYACRAGTTGPYHFAYEARDAYCWSLWNAKDTVRPRPVGTRQPNPWGLFDINGNVREWCLDWYAEDAYATPHRATPTGPSAGTLRVIRGGCFIDLDSFMRSSRRGYLKPDQIHNNQGFRVVEIVAEPGTGS